MTTPPAIGLRHVAIKVVDLARVERFWVDVLGYAVEWRPDPDNVYLARSGDNVALHRVATADPRAGTLDHVGIVVARPDDVDEWAAHLETCGLTLEAKPKTHRDGARSLYVRDPEGNLVQIIFHPPISG